MACDADDVLTLELVTFDELVITGLVAMVPNYVAAVVGTLDSALFDQTELDGPYVQVDDALDAGPDLIGASKISSFLSSIANAVYGRVNIAVHSHSIGMGVNATDSVVYNAANMLLWNDKCQYAVMTKRLCTVLGGSPSSSSQSMVSGSASPRTTNPLFTVGGGAVAAAASWSNGPGGWRINFTAGTHTLSFTAIGQNIKFYGTADATGRQLRWSAPSVAGGATQTATGAGSVAYLNGGAFWYEFIITGASPGETVTLIGPTTGVVTVHMIDPDYKTTPGITLHRACLTGGPLVEIHATALDSSDTAGPNALWLGGTTTTINRRTDQGNSMSMRENYAGIILQTDVNDLNNFDTAGSPWGYTLADHQRHLANYLAYHAANNIPVIVVFGPIRDPAYQPGARPYNQEDLIAAYKATVAAASNAAYIDLTEQFTGSTYTDRYNAQVAAGVMDPNSAIVHPGEVGHAFFGEQIADAILDAI